LVISGSEHERRILLVEDTRQDVIHHPFGLVSPEGVVVGIEAWDLGLAAKYKNWANRPHRISLIVSGKRCEVPFSLKEEVVESCFAVRIRKMATDKKSIVLEMGLGDAGNGLIK